MQTPHPRPWWESRPGLLRFVADLVAGELAALRHDPSLQVEGWTEAVEAQDRPQWSGTRTFAVGARHDGAVQVGGVNVFPARVRDVLLEHPAVADCTVRLMRPGEGVRLKAFIVPRAGYGEDLDGEPP